MRRALYCAALVVSALFGACVLNPQPQPPGASDSTTEPGGHIAVADAGATNVAAPEGECDGGACVTDGGVESDAATSTTTGDGGADAAPDAPDDAPSDSSLGQD